MNLDKDQLKRHIRKSDLTAMEKRYLEGLVDGDGVIHAKWEWGEDGWQCGECKKPLEDTLIFYYDNRNGEPDVKHCPNCGAKMDGGKENGKNL